MIETPGSTNAWIINKRQCGRIHVDKYNNIRQVIMQSADKLEESQKVFCVKDITNSEDTSKHFELFYVQSDGLLYAETLKSTVGICQESARASKENIKNVISATTPMTMSFREGEQTPELSDISVETVIDFVQNLQPVTFNYKGNTSQEALQLGLITDDITDHEIYKYIGINKTETVEIEPGEYDEEGKVIKEAVVEERQVLGLQPLPLATAALTTCKYLLDQLNNVYAMNEDLQGQLDDINERLKALETK